MSTCTEIDKKSIDMMSFVPTVEDIKKLLEHSNKVVAAPVNFFTKEDEPLKTPDVSVLTRIYTKQPLVEGEHFGILADRGKSLLGDSNGPNGVLHNFDKTYEVDRYNLFYETPQKTLKLLEDYIKFRNNNIDAIWTAYIDRLIKDLESEDKYQMIRKVFINIKKQIEADGNNLQALHQNGIDVVSYCQTWLRNGGAVGKAEFSVPSPHFQTRFFVYDDDKFGIAGALADELNKEDEKDVTIEANQAKTEYIDLIKNFNTQMKKYGDGSNQAFVRLDKELIERLKSMPESPDNNQPDNNQPNSGGGKLKKSKSKKMKKSKSKSKKSKRNLRKRDSTTIYNGKRVHMINRPWRKTRKTKSKSKSKRSRKL
jgi:hypothetical protein